MLLDKLTNLGGSNKDMEAKVSEELLQNIRNEIPKIREWRQAEEERQRLEELRKEEERKKKREEQKTEETSGPVVHFKLTLPKQKTFQELLLEEIEARKMTNVEFYKAAGIDRKLFSTIKNNKNYQPNKDTAVACCLGLKLTVPEADKLLRAAGFALSYSLDWDCVIHYCLEHEIWNIVTVNEILYDITNKCIGCK